jgi:hypothetical protein
VRYSLYLLQGGCLGSSAVGRSRCLHREVSGDRKLVGLRWLAEPRASAPMQDLTVDIVEDPPCRRAEVALLAVYVGGLLVFHWAVCVPMHTLRQTCSCPVRMSVCLSERENCHAFNGLHTLAKYLQGKFLLVSSMLCEKGHAFPAWHCPCLKNLQGTCEVSEFGRVSLLLKHGISCSESVLFVLGGLRGPSKAPMLAVPLCREVPFGM